MSHSVKCSFTNTLHGTVRLFVLCFAVYAPLGCRSIQNENSSIAIERHTLQHGFNISHVSVVGNISNKDVSNILYALKLFGKTDNNVVGIVRLHFEDWDAVRLYTKHWRIDFAKTIKSDWVIIGAGLYVN